MSEAKFIYKMTSVAVTCTAALFFLGAGTVSAESILLRNGIVHTVSGETFTNGEVLMDGDKITLVLDGKGPESIVANKVIDLKGQHLYPGMIDMDELAGVDGNRIDPRDGRHDGSGQLHAGCAVVDRGEPGFGTDSGGAGERDWVFRMRAFRRRGGGNVVGGSGGGVDDGANGVQARVALHVYWPEMELDTTPKEKFKDKSKFKSLEDQAKERQKKLKELDDFSLEARAYEKAHGTKMSGKAGDFDGEPTIRSDAPGGARGNPHHGARDEVRARLRRR